MREKNISKAVRDSSGTGSDQTHQRSVRSEEIRPRVYWSRHPSRPSTSWDLDDLVNKIQKSTKPAVCIIEDLEKHSRWLAGIGQDLDLDEDFLNAHISQVRDNVIREHQPWRWVTPPDHQQLLDTYQDWRCIEGFYSLPTSPKTRISYYRHSRHVCKFTYCPVAVDRLMRARSVPGEQSACCCFNPTQLARQ
jgi:hypothetical protein